MNILMPFEWLSIVIAVALGLILGWLASLLWKRGRIKEAKEIAAQLWQEGEVQREKNLEAVVNNVKESFGRLSLDALSKSTDEFLKLAKGKLDTERELTSKELHEKKSLIDKQLEGITEELKNVSTMVKDFEKDRVEKFGFLSNALKMTSEQTKALTMTTNNLREALSSSKVRGQWGERIAEDILQLAGFIENINYQKQETIEGIGTRPDFTFFLPKGLKLNMDVKFPWDNYNRYIESGNDVEREKYQGEFLKDMKLKIKEVTSRDYINPEQKTVDYVLLFIPNEQVYRFIHETDSSFIDLSLKNKVILCSPLTLFAVLAVIRQSVENFALERTSNEILTLLSSFKKQWGEYQKKFETLGRRIEDVQKEYDILVSTRRRQLEKPLDQIEALRTRQQLSEGGVKLIPTEPSADVEKLEVVEK